MLNLYMLCRNLTIASYVKFVTDIAFIHLVNVSISTNKNLNPPGALGKMSTMSIPQVAKGQERSISRRGFICFIVCF
jgi:L-cysteine desulfidase